jgi:ERCC4-related helicase
MWEALFAVQKSEDKDSLRLDDAYGLKAMEPSDAQNQVGSHSSTSALRKALVDYCRPFYKPKPLSIETSTPKVGELVKLLCQYRHDPDFKGIIFVQRRATAIMLAELLRSVPALAEFCHTEAVTGHGQGGTYGTGMKSVKNFRVLDEFKRGAVNLVIATKVIDAQIFLFVIVLKLIIKTGCRGRHPYFCMQAGCAV